MSEPTQTANSSQQTTGVASQALIVRVTPSQALIPHHAHLGPGRLLNKAYEKISQTVGAEINELVHSCGGGPTALLGSILGSLKAAPDGYVLGDDKKTIRKLKSLLYYANPPTMPSTQITAFKAVLELVTTYFSLGMRGTLLECLELRDDHTASSLLGTRWEPNDDPGRDSQIDFFLNVAVSTLCDHSMNIASIVENIPLTKLARAPVLGECAIDKLLIATQGTSKIMSDPTPLTRLKPYTYPASPTHSTPSTPLMPFADQCECILAVRYLATILNHTTFWLPEHQNEHRVAARRIIKRTRELVEDLPSSEVCEGVVLLDVEGTDRLATAVLSGMNSWEAPLNNHRGGETQEWISEFHLLLVAVTAVSDRLPLAAGLIQAAWGMSLTADVIDEGQEDATHTDIDTRGSLDHAPSGVSLQSEIIGVTRLHDAALGEMAIGPAYIKALLIGLQYPSFQYPLKGSKEDIQVAEKAIQSISSHAQITVMGDWLAKEDPMYPVRDNVWRELEGFIEPQRDNVQYIVWFAGHSGQTETKSDPMEEDGHDECIVLADAPGISHGSIAAGTQGLILDNDLSMVLVETLRRITEKNRFQRVSLLSIFDSGRGGTLLDLPHHRCNRNHNCHKCVREPKTLQSAYYGPRLPTTSQLRRPATPNVIALAAPASLNHMRYKLQKAFHDYYRRCSEFYKRIPERPPLVISISAGRDQEFLAGVKDHRSMSQSIAAHLASHPDSTFGALMRELSECSDENLKRRDEEWNEYFRCSHNPTKERPEASKALSNHEISSLYPLRMNGRLLPNHSPTRHPTS